MLKGKEKNSLWIAEASLQQAASMEYKGVREQITGTEAGCSQSFANPTGA